MRTVTERVQAGAKFLDKHKPGWWQDIDVKRLNLGSPCRCILGQLYHDFNEGIEWLRDIDFDTDPDALGFDVDEYDWPETSKSFAALTKAWKEEIQARRVAEKEARRA